MISLEGKKYDNETLSITQGSLWKNHVKNEHQKLVPDPFLILVNNPNQLLYARNYFENKIFLNLDYQKAFEKLLNFSFWTQSLLLGKIIKNKMGLELVTSCSSGYKTNSEGFLYW